MKFPSIPLDNLAKVVLSQIVAINVGRIARRSIANRFDLEPDGAILEIGSFVLGELVAGAVAPLTDGLVDKTAAEIVKHRNEREQQKKSAE